MTHMGTTSTQCTQMRILNLEQLLSLSTWSATYVAAAVFRTACTRRESASLVGVILKKTKKKRKNLKKRNFLRKITNSKIILLQQR
jgi:hypothetical protein